MAFPTNVAKLPWTATPQKTGIQIGLYPSTNPQVHVELQRAVGTTSAASTSFTGIGTFAWDELVPWGSLYTYKDQLPLSDKVYSYRARGARTGFTASTWTATISARPDTLQDSPSPRPFARIRTISTAAVSGGGTGGALVSLGPSSYAVAMQHTASTVASSSDATKNQIVTVTYGDVYQITVQGSYTYTSGGSTGIRGSVTLLRNPQHAFGVWVGTWTAQTYLVAGMPPAGTFHLSGLTSLAAGDRVGVRIAEAFSSGTFTISSGMALEIKRYAGTV